ncbi:MAG: DUF2807 domain-containing protein [Bacteroidales bacterium]|nr:DUF2807 domain-containing protein [Bacteroidales bacterium]
MYTSDCIALPPFEEVQVKSVFHIYLKQDTAYSITIRGNREFTEGVRYEVENDLLILSNETRMMWMNPENHIVEIYISADRPKKIMAEEACFIETVNPVITEEFGFVCGNKYAEARFELDNAIFYFWNNFPCGGRLTLEGKTQSLRLWNYVIMSVDAINLITSHAFVENHSKGDCFVNVTGQLQYSIHGTGNIVLYGNPDEIVLLEKTSSGELIRME